MAVPTDRWLVCLGAAGASQTVKSCRATTPAVLYIPRRCPPPRISTALNSAQRRAVTYGEPLPEKGVRAGPLLVIAGAGTGKTSTIAHRVAQLVAQGSRSGATAAVDLHAPRRERDAAACHTTSCARRSAIRSATRRRRCCSDWHGPGTFHSIGNRLLRHYARHLQARSDVHRHRSG